MMDEEHQDPEWASADEYGDVPDLTVIHSEVDIPKAFPGLTHEEVLGLEFPEERMLVEDLIPIGAVGTIAGVPETFKSWQAQRLAVIVASGTGDLFGKEVTHSGPVGYFWQDDSTREEAERIKLYHAVHDRPDDLPIRWFLNEGLRLPGDLDRLRLTIVEYGFVLVILDSFYNVLYGKDLKDEEAEMVIAELKSTICDVTGCTVVIVDHMPWATDVNRQRLRAYGGVFKGAATRFGIYLDAVQNKTYLEARGNNITGIKRQICEWDPDALELTLVGPQEVVSDEDYDQRILDHLTDHHDQTTDQMDAIHGTTSHLKEARKRLLDEGRVTRERGRTSFKGFVWNLSVHAGSTRSMEFDRDGDGESFDTGSNELDGEPVNPSGTKGSTRSIDDSTESDREDGISRSITSPSTRGEGDVERVLNPNAESTEDDDEIPW